LCGQGSNVIASEGESKDGAGIKLADLGASQGRDNLFVTTNKLFLTESVLTVRHCLFALNEKVLVEGDTRPACFTN